ncbi:MAG: adenosine deaminase family protein, partial [Bryobacteraceae bacterium]
YAIATRDLIARLARQNVVYAEITLSAGVVLWKKQDLGAIYEAVWNESRRAPFPVFWILDAVRQFDPEDGVRVAEFAVSRKDDGVIGFGIGGDEERGPARRFAHVFRFAREGGLRLTCHAGETTGPGSIWDALEVGAELIGHVIAAIQDPALVAHLRERGIPLEVCITSNLRTWVVASLARHPVRKLFDAGVPIVLNTDDPALFETTLDGEYELARDQFGFTDDELALLAENSLRYVFRRPS